MSGKGKSGGSDPDKKVGSFLTGLVIFGLIVAVILFLYAHGRKIREEDSDQSLNSPLSQLADWSEHLPTRII